MNLLKNKNPIYRVWVLLASRKTKKTKCQYCDMNYDCIYQNYSRVCTHPDSYGVCGLHWEIAHTYVEQYHYDIKNIDRNKIYAIALGDWDTYEPSEKDYIKIEEYIREMSNK